MKGGFRNGRLLGFPRMARAFYYKYVGELIVLFVVRKSCIAESRVHNYLDAPLVISEPLQKST